MVIEVLSALIGSAANKVLGGRMRASRVSVTLVGEPPYSRLANYFFPGISHPSELKSGLYVGQPQDAYGVPYRRWVNTNGGVPLDTSAFQLVIQCIGEHNVMLVGGRAITTEIGDLQGVSVVHPSGGPIESERLEIALDDGEMLCYPASTPFEPAQPIPLQYRIEPSQSELFRVFGYAGSQAMSWYLELDFVVDGKRITKTVTQPKEKPFITIPFDHPGIEAEFRQTPSGWDRV